VTRDRRSTTLGALLEQGHLAGELGELALKIGESFFGGTVRKLTDDALARSLAHEDGPCLVDPTPRSLLVIAHVAHPVSSHDFGYWR
jgi:hypothetical protein